MRKGWEYKKLGEVLETTSGGTPSKSHKEYYEGGTIPWLRSGEVSKGDIYDAELYITEEGLKKSSAKLFPIDTVLIAMYGATVGQVGILKSTMCTNQAICGILPNKDFHPNFLKYVLLANKKNYLKQAIGGAQPNISQQVIKSTYIPIVKFSEQESVVSELDKINELIRLKKEQLKDFDNLAQSLFYEMFGDPVENEKGWEVKKLGELLKVIGGYAFKSDKYKDEGIPILRIGNINSGFFRDTNLVFAESDEKLEKYKIFPGDIVISLTGTVGKSDYGNVCFMDDAYNFYYLNQRNAKLEIFGNLEKYYLSAILKNEDIKSRLTSISRGVRQANIANKDIENLQIPLPPLPLQHLFAHRIEQIEHQKAEVQKAITDLETLLASRMQYWFE